MELLTTKMDEEDGPSDEKIEVPGEKDRDVLRRGGGCLSVPTRLRQVDEGRNHLPERNVAGHRIRDRNASGRASMLYSST